MIRLSKSCLSSAEKNAVLGVLDREYLGMGAEVKIFEDALADYFGRSVACVATGTAALQLALQAAECGPDSEVLVQSLTFVASFQAITACGATPVACDILPDSLTIDLEDAARRVTKKTKAIMPVHYSGGVGQLENIYQFARDHKLRVIEDASHAFGTTHGGKRVGSFGDIVCFSFDGIKNITCGEGGAVVTADPAVHKAVQDARLLGVENDSEKRYSGARSWNFDVRQQGWRYHMSNIMAAIGYEQLQRFPEFARKRQALACRYRDNLANITAVKLINIDYNEVVPHIFPLRLLNVTRDKIMEHLASRDIQTGFHYQPNHQLSLFRTDYRLPITEHIFPQLLTLPLHPDVTESEVDFVCEQLSLAVGEA